MTNIPGTFAVNTANNTQYDVSLEMLTHLSFRKQRLYLLPESPLFDDYFHEPA